MRHIANFIKIVPLHQFISWNGTTITATTDVDIFQSETDTSFNEVPDSKNGNPYYKQSLKVVTLKQPDTIRAKYPPNIPVVVIMYTDDSQPHIIGHENSKLRLTIEPTSSENVYTFYRESVKPLF